VDTIIGELQIIPAVIILNFRQKFWVRITVATPTIQTEVSVCTSVPPAGLLPE
jgi:hypothetical protein